MIKILSWKINSGVYAYIYPINDGKYISNRIPEDSPIWKDIIEIMSKEWDKNAYKTNFDAMNKELESKYGKTIEWDDKYWNFNDENYPDGINIVLLSGKDGVGVAGEGEKTDGDSENIDEIVQEIENKLNKAREEIEKKNEEVENFIEEKVSQTIANAQKTINETKEELSAVREELTEGLNSAKDALKKASELFDFNGEISQDDIIDAVSTTKEYGEWLEDYSEDLTSLKSDYDAAAKAMGSIGEAEDVSKGLFSKMATSISVVSGAVGTVESTMNASLGEIKDMATWYDTNKDDATEAIRLISASGAQIQDTIDFINGDGLTTHLNTIMDGKNADIKQEILAETDEYIGSVRREMNAMSGAIEDTIVRLSDETLTSMGDRMNAIDSEMEKWLTKFDELCGTTIDLRDTWTLESGKLSSIASLIPETDEYGNILYYVSSVTLSDNSIQTIPELEVVRVETDNIGSYLYMAKNKDEAGDLRDYIWKEAYMKLSSQMTSYIQQEVSSITFSIVNDEGLTAAIKLAITGSTEGDEEPIITMIAKEVVISADLIASAISTNTANIGGIVIGNGVIRSNNGGFVLSSAGTITANNVSLSGSVYANNAVISGTVYANNAVISGTVYADKGEISGIKINTSSLSATNFSVTSDGVVVANDIIIKGGNLIGGDIIDGKLVFNDINGNPQTYFGQSTGEEDPILFTGLNERITLIGFKLRKNQTRVVGGEVEDGPDIYAYTNDVNEVIGNINSVTEKTIDNITVFEKTRTNQYKKIDNPFVTYFLKNNSDGIFIEESGSTIKNYDIYLGSESDFNLINYRKAFIYITAQDFSDDILKISNANLKFFEDGTIDCREIKSENAYIKGYIDAEGEFKGALKNAHGDLDTIKINNNLSLLNPLNDKNIFNLTKNKIEGCYSIYVDTSDVNFYSQNKSTEAKTYKSSKEILSLKDINGKTVEINSFNIKLHRFIPFNRCLNEFGEASVEIEIWKNGTKVKTIQNSLPRGCGKETQDNVITYEGDKFDNVNSMKIFVSCKIPTTARYGASYCSAQLAIDSFIVTVKEEATGFFIGSDGFRYISPEGEYGLQVNSNGVKFLSSTTWVTLEQYIKTIVGK